ncbi:MAG: response regulator [Candidatus Omnitrophica bacterium]|nr:response regulator [Candidatus Omnitrophota bacterium]
MAKNILVIDDDGMVTKSLCELLNKTGFSADALDNGFDAIEKIKDTHIDLVVVDIRMPEIDGVETVKRIKEILKSKHRPDIPVVFITGYTDSKINLEAKELGEVIFKPFNNQEFLECIAHYTWT